MEEVKNTVINWDNIGFDDNSELRIDIPVEDVSEEETVIIGEDTGSENDDTKQGVLFDNNEDKNKEESKVKDEENEVEEDNKVKEGKAEEKSEKTEEDKEEQDEKEKENEEESASLADYIDYLVKQGLIDEEKANQIETLDDLVELQEEIVTAQAEKMLEGLEEKLGDIGVKFLKWIAGGGDPLQFINNIEKISTIPEYIEGDENSYEKVVSYYLKEVKGLNDDEISDYIEVLKNKDMLDVRAEKYYEELKKIQEEKEKELLEQQKKQKEEQKKLRKQFENTVKKLLNETDEINGLPLTEEDKKELYEYITKPAKVVNGQYITKFQDDFNQYIAGDIKNQIMLAKLLKEGLDLSKYFKRAERETTKKIRKKIQKSAIKETKPKNIIEFLERLQ